MEKFQVAGLAIADTLAGSVVLPQWGCVDGPISWNASDRNSGPDLPDDAAYRVLSLGLGRIVPGGSG